MRVLTAIILGVLAALCGVSLHPSAAAPAAGCSARTELARAVAQLGADPDQFVIGRLPKPVANAGGATFVDGRYHSHVIISPAMPCAFIGDAVRHEWMHVQQFSYFGADHLPPTRTEMEADCGSWMLGSQYTPYIDQARRSGDVGCNADDVLIATFLIKRAGVRPVRYL